MKPLCCSLFKNPSNTHGKKWIMISCQYTGELPQEHKLVSFRKRNE